MSKKPSFANLGERLTRKAVESPQPISPIESIQLKKTGSAAPVKASNRKTSSRGRQSDGRRGILVRARPEAWKALKQIALDSDRTLQDLMTEAVNDILTKNGMSPLA